MKSIKIITLSSVLASSLFAIDTVSNLSANAPHNSVASTNDASIVFTWNPPTSDDKYYYKLDTNSSNTYADDVNRANWSTKDLTGDEPTAATITHSLPTVATSGTYYYHVVAVDGSDNTSNTVTSTAMNIDLDKGTVTVSPNGGSISSATTLTLSGSETGTIYYTIDGSTPTTSSTVYSAPLVIATSKTVKSILVDTAGNIGDVVTKAFTSTAQPTVKTTQDTTTADGTTFATSNSAGATSFNTSLTVSGGVDTDGFTRYKYKKSTDSSYTEVSNIANTIDISSLESGTYTYYILGGDAYNYIDESSKKTVTFTVDNTAPTSLTVKYNNDSTVTTVNPENVTGETEITITAVDASSYGYEVTTSAASCSTSFTSYTTYSSGFNLGTESSLSDGQQVKVCMAAKDSSGNWGSTSKTFTIDKTAPTVTMPNAQSFGGTITEYISSVDAADTIKYTIADPESGVCSTTKTYDTLANTYSSSVEISGTSSKCLYGAAMDTIENKSAVSSTLFTYSSSQATLNLDLIDNAVFATVDTYGATPYTDINVTGSNLAIYTYEFDANSTVYNENFSDTTDNLISLSALTADAEHNVTIVGYSDNNTTNSSKLRVFTIDNTRPASFDASDYNDSNFTTASYTLTLSKPAGADYIMYSEDNTTFTTSSAASVDVILSATTTLYTKSKDNAGNMSTVYSATLTQDIPVQTYSLSAGWNLVTLPSDTLSNSGLSSAYVWDYNGTAWGNSIASDSYEDISTASSSKGYWVYVSSSTDITINGGDTSDSNLILDASSGWSLLGTTSALTDYSDANLTWAYNSGIWSYDTNMVDLNSTLNNLGYNQIETIPAFSGYWIYKE